MQLLTYFLSVRFLKFTASFTPLMRNADVPRSYDKLAS